MFILVSTLGFFFLAKMREREWDNQMFRFGRGKLGMENYQIWEFFSNSNKELVFFSSSLSSWVVFFFPWNYQFSQFFLSMTWRLFCCWCRRHRGQFGQIKLTQHRVYKSHIILPINDCFPYLINLRFEYYIFFYINKGPKTQVSIFFFGRNITKK